MSRFVFSLGLIPVQAWIAEARRSRDLRASSAFLCYVMAKLLTQLTDRSQAAVWLPQEQEAGDFRKLAEGPFSSALEQTYGIPNRASGHLEAADLPKAAQMLAALEPEIVEKTWEELEDQHLRSSLSGDKDFWRELEAPLASYRKATKGGDDVPLQLVWVLAHPVGPEPDPRRDLEPIDRLFVDVKRSRPVRPWRHGRPVGKCNQCGAREAMGPDADYHTWREWHVKVAQLPWIERGVRIDAGERLCYVCLAKRLAGYASRRPFRSTGEVAIGPWQRRVRELGAGALLDRLQKTELGREDLGRALFLADDRLRERGGEEALALRRELREQIRKAGAKSPTPVPLEPPSYLALLAFDGDRMGRHVARDPEGVPRGMAAFAQKARRLLEDHQAEVFYLAGDEGLAMAPAATALDLARGLRAGFTTAFEDLAHRPTLSMGLVLFEQSRPMAGAIRAARAHLEEAKELEGKDALAVGVETSSGSRWSHAAHWGEGWDRIATAVRLVRDGKLSRGWAYDAERFVRSLPPSAWQETFLEAIRAEIERLLFRRLEMEGKDAAERLARKEETWQALGGPRWWHPDEATGAVEPGLEQFHLIGFLARHVGPAPAEEPRR